MGNQDRLERKKVYNKNNDRKVARLTQQKKHVAMDKLEDTKQELTRNTISKKKRGRTAVKKTWQSVRNVVQSIHKKEQ